MYSGIIQHIGRVASVAPETGGGKRLCVEAPAGFLKSLSFGSSVNVNGVCLTVVLKDATSFQTDVMPQSLKLTTIDTWNVGTSVNLETSLRVGDELGGHFLYGHVDGVAELLDRTSEGNAELFRFSLPKHLVRFLVPQGSVAIDGVSLTVVATQPLTVSLIPETRSRSTLGSKKSGDVVNLEIDMFMKYVKGYGATD